MGGQGAKGAHQRASQKKALVSRSLSGEGVEDMHSRQREQQVQTCTSLKCGWREGVAGREPEGLVGASFAHQQ